MKRHILFVLAAVLVPAGTGVALFDAGGPAGAAVVKFNNATDTANCSSFSGKVTITPALSGTGALPTVIKVSGKLFGCSDGTGNISGSATLPGGPFWATVSGSLSGASNNVGTLVGCTDTVGALTVTWKGVYIDPSTHAAEPLLYPKTVVNVQQFLGGSFMPGAPFNTLDMNTVGYGQFQIGNGATAGGCRAPTVTAPGAFLGTDGGASTSTVVVTSLDLIGTIFGQGNTAKATTLTIGIGTLYAG